MIISSILLPVSPGYLYVGLRDGWRLFKLKCSTNYHKQIKEVSLNIPPIISPHLFAVRRYLFVYIQNSAQTSFLLFANILNNDEYHEHIRERRWFCCTKYKKQHLINNAICWMNIFIQYLYLFFDSDKADTSLSWLAVFYSQSRRCCFIFLSEF